MGKIRISPILVFLFCFAVYMGWETFVLYAVLAAACHEAAHVITILLMGGRITQISLGPSGACLESAPMGYLQEIICAFVGPATNLVLFSAARHSCFPFAFCNLVFFLYNALPVYPLDGGRILQALLSTFLSDGLTANIMKIIFSLVLAIMLAIAVFLTISLKCGLWPILAVTLVFGKTVFERKDAKR